MDNSLVASKLFAIELELYGVLKMLEKLRSLLNEVGMDVGVLEDVRRAIDMITVVYYEVRKRRKEIEGVKNDTTR